MPFVAAMLKVRLSRIGRVGDANPTSLDVWFHRARPNREQGSSITGSLTLPQEP